MAAPPEITITKLSGKYAMNKTLGDNPEAFFTLQGLSWLTRKAVMLASVTLILKEFEEDGATHIDIDSIASGLSTTNEYRVLTWTERDHEDRIFGKVKGKSRFFKRGAYEPEPTLELSPDEKKFLLGESLRDGTTSTFVGDDDHIETIAVSVSDGWTVDQVWGFEEVNGERRYTRRFLCKKNGKSEKMRLVYDYLGPLDA